MTLDELIGALAPDGEGALVAPVVDSWTQGRTLYGGATAALSLSVARRTMPDLPPLRSAQVAFVGPIADTAAFRPRLLRSGRSAAFVGVEVKSGGALAANLTLVFAADRESAVDLPAAGDLAPVTGPVLRVPEQIRFASNFDLWFAGEEANPCNRWVRLKEESALDAEIELLAVADLLPPPALFDFDSFVPLSTMSWQLDLLRPAARSDDRRWRLVAEKEVNAGGLSTQSMRVDDGEGAPVARGRQLVALFG